MLASLTWFQKPFQLLIPFHICNCSLLPFYIKIQYVSSLYALLHYSQQMHCILFYGIVLFVLFACAFLVSITHYIILDAFCNFAVVSILIYLISCHSLVIFYFFRFCSILGVMFHFYFPWRRSCHQSL